MNSPLNFCVEIPMFAGVDEAAYCFVAVCWFAMCVQSIFNCLLFLLVPSVCYVL